MNWNELTLEEKHTIIKHNRGLGSNFNVGSFVICKNNGVIRYITEIKKETFKDNGEISGCEPSPNCHYKNYKIIKI